MMAKPRFRLVPYRMLPYIDWPLIALTLALLVFGIITLWGATSAGQGVGLFPIPGYPRQQMIFALVGMAIMIGLIFFDYRKLGRVVWPLYGLMLLSLVGLLIKAETIKGATSWYKLGPVNIQPSEPAKIVIVLALAWFLARRMLVFRGLRHTFLPLAILALPLMLILKQNDLGTSMVLIPVTGAMFWVAGLRKWVFLLFLALGVSGAVAVYPHLKPHQKQRIETYLHPEADLRGKGWNIFQAKTTLGSGELTGKGWGKGTQTQFRFLPEYHTDFIFPTVGEQFGLIGCLIVVALFTLLIGRMAWLAMRTNDTFGILVITGLATMLCTHAIQNIGMVMGLLPITGLPLPFFSYGGSFMLTCFAAIGLSLSIGARRGL